MTTGHLNGLSKAALFSCVLTLSAQTIDTGMLGTVSDPGGAVIASASVTITSPATGFTRTVTTTADGKYEVRYLVPGEYSIEVQAPGFRTERRTRVGSRSISRFAWTSPCRSATFSRRWRSPARHPFSRPKTPPSVRLSPRSAL